MTKEINTTDAELEALMAELEEQNTAFATPPTAAVVVEEEPPASVAPWEDEPVAAVVAPPVTVVEPEPEPVVDLTRVIWIHHASSCSVFKGTVADLGKEDLSEVTASEGLALAKKYKAAETAEAARATEAAAAKKAKADRLTAEAETAAKEPPVVVAVPVAPKPTPVSAPLPSPTSPPTEPSLKFYVDAAQFQKDTRVSDVDLDRCMIEQNSLRAFYGTQAAHSEAQASRLKARFEVVEATLYNLHRKALLGEGEKPTVQAIESAVKMDGRWLSGKNMLIEAETIAAINKSLVESLKDRRDMIIQLGADRRDEGKGAVRILAEQQERQELRERALNGARAA